MARWRMVMGLALLVGGAVGMRLVITSSTATGAIVSTVVLPGDARAVALDGRTKHIFVVDDPSQGAGATPGRVYVLDTYTGAVLHTVTVGRAPDFALVDERTGRVFVVHGGAGGVSVLDAASGALQRNIDLGRIPRAVVVDAQARRAVVISGRGAISAPDAWGWVPPLLRRVIPFLSQPGPHTRIVPSSVTILDTSHL